MTPEQTRDTLQFLLSIYPSQRQRMQPIDVRGMWAAYSAGLGDLEFDRVKEAITRLARSEKWLPTIAEIRAAVGVIEHGPQVAGAEAWGSVMKAIRRWGVHRHPGKDFEFGDPITERVVRALGWTDICSSENIQSERARFIDAYAEIAKVERTEAQASTGGRNAQLDRREELRALPAPPDLVRQLAEKLTDADRAEMSALARKVARDSLHVEREIPADTEESIADTIDRMEPQ